MLAAKQLDQILGVDVHMVVIAGVPAPIPHPFIGKVFDLMAYLPIIGTTVYVNGKLAAQAGTEVKALPPHIPLGGPFAPAAARQRGRDFHGLGHRALRRRAPVADGQPGTDVFLHRHARPAA